MSYSLELEDSIVRFLERYWDQVGTLELRHPPIAGFTDRTSEYVGFMRAKPDMTVHVVMRDGGFSRILYYKMVELELGDWELELQDSEGYDEGPSDDESAP